jgi:hypothetical protein
MTINGQQTGDKEKIYSASKGRCPKCDWKIKVYVKAYQHNDYRPEVEFEKVGGGTSEA